MKRTILLGLLAFLLPYKPACSQSNISVRETATNVLNKGLGEIDLGYYPGTLLLHAMSELALSTGSDSLLASTIEYYKQFTTGEIQGHGSFISYRAGGSGVPFLVYNKKEKQLISQSRETAKLMFEEQKRSSEGILVPPWVDQEADQVFIDVAFAVTPHFCMPDWQKKTLNT
ncbi:MAG: hypothetical protein HC896_04220 [Bacteroidales bacterium]|nr:hypothetical protein [Bacteroidales bacterium]